MQSLESISDGEGNENAKKQKTLNEAIDEQHHDIGKYTHKAILLKVSLQQNIWLAWKQNNQIKKI